MRSRSSFGNGMYKSATRAKRGRTLGLIIRGRSDESWWIRGIRTWYLSQRLATLTARTRIVASIAQVMAGRMAQSFFKGENIGAIDLAFDPRDPRTIYATLWNTRRPPWSVYPPSYGPAAGFSNPLMAAISWQQLTAGLPTERVGALESQLRPGIQISSTQLLMPKKAACTARMMAALRGTKCRTIGVFGAAVGISAKWRGFGRSGDAVRIEHFGVSIERRRQNVDGD